MQQVIDAPFGLCHIHWQLIGNEQEPNIVEVSSCYCASIHTWYVFARNASRSVLGVKRLCKANAAPGAGMSCASVQLGVVTGTEACSDKLAVARMG